MGRRWAAASLSSQLAAAILAAGLVATAFFATLGLLAIRSTDADAAAREMRLAEAGLRAEAERLVGEQRASTVWNDAVLRVHARDLDWIDANLGSWMHDYFGHDEDHVLTPEGLLLYRQRGGVAEDPPPRTAHDPALGPLVARLRAEIAAPGAEVAELAVVDSVRLGGHAALVSVVPIVPDSEAIRQAPEAASLHVAVRYADADLAARIAQTYEFREASFLPAPPGGDLAAVALRDASGAALAWLSWQPERPGHRIARTMAPVLAGFLLFGGGLMAWLVRSLWIASQRLHRSEAEARYLSLHDPLAGVANRTLFETRLAEALVAARQGGPPVGLLVLDLDRFKMVNDRLGHPAGDELIRQVAGRLKAHVRAADTVARLGGDEFGVILVGIPDEAALGSFCGGLVHMLSAPYDLSPGLAHVGASVGAIWTAGDALPEELMQRADAALYRAKAEGRSRYGLFTPEMDRMLRQRHQIEHDLRTAIAQGCGQFRLLYQPIFDADDLLVGAEALLRWSHPDRGLLMPEVFLDLAEETGLIRPLGLWVVEQAAGFAFAAGLPRIAVNISPVQLSDDRFPEEVLALLERTGLPPPRLELEVTEAFALDPGRAAALERLRAAGVAIVLDDFATGQSLLRHVRDCRIDTIKIDRSFVSRLGSGDGTDQLVRAILELGRAMGIAVTAEGVENPAQRDSLIAMGCRMFQGFLLGRPMEPLRLAAMLARQEAAQKRA